MKLFTRSILPCILVSALAISAIAQLKPEPVVVDQGTRHVISNDVRNPYGRMRLALRATSRYNTVETKDSDWAFALGAGGITDNQYPGLFIFSPGTPSCANDFAFFPINATPSVGGQANLGGLYNLYTGTGSSYCPNSVNQTPPTTNATGPSVLFAYAVGSAQIKTSPVVSLNGKKIAVVESGTIGKVHIITWAKQSGSPTNMTTNAIAPPSEVVLTLSGVTNCMTGQAVNRSSVFVDYGTDIGYVGDGNGRMWRINNIFLGTPTIAYCNVISTTGSGLGTPIPDSASSNIFVNDGQAMYSVTAGTSSFTVNGSVTIGASNGSTDDPLVDGFGFVYNYVRNDGVGAGSVAMYQTKNDLSSTVKVTLGAATTNPVYIGDFNNAFNTSGPTASGARGYAWGYNNATSGVPTINAVSFNATTGVMSTTPAFSNNAKCEAATPTAGTGENMMDLFDSNTSTDQLFTSVSPNGRVCRWAPLPTNNNTTPANQVTGYAGGASGMTNDGDTGTVVQQGSIYFGLGSTTTGICGTTQLCLVKLKETDLSIN